jgi:hypothetical protein
VGCQAKSPSQSGSKEAQSARRPDIGKPVLPLPQLGRLPYDGVNHRDALEALAPVSLLMLFPGILCPPDPVSLLIWQAGSAGEWRFTRKVHQRLILHTGRLAAAMARLPAYCGRRIAI